MTTAARALSRRLHDSGWRSQVNANRCRVLFSEPLRASGRSLPLAIGSSGDAGAGPMLGTLIEHLLGDTTLPGLPIAFVLGAAVGAEREWRQSTAAGLRSCVLVSVAAAAFADLMVSRADPVSLGAGFGAIATGVGFLGAGAILREGANIRGLSTAATIWCVAAIGAQAGAGETVGAIWLTILVLLINTVLKPLQRLIRRRRPAVPSAQDAALEG
jgi:putative Mg2+ transporter-C (MgtC) family protein